jgi:predicted  nucleic acid-binding Zn-ribbon protein
MEITQVFMFGLGLIVMMLGYYLSQVSSDIKELEHNMTSCQAELPRVYVLKEDYKDEIQEVKARLEDIYGIVRELSKK